jgi:MinD-like ATPase involved in chromosome partitioning or flagellar assembly
VQTITFYAYKGGTGRTLALANAAKYLARLGQSVFAIDLDLEAPGLHHKLRLDTQERVTPITQGVVDCIHAFAVKGMIPETLAPFSVEIPREEERDGKITLMPAGDTITATYWKRLAELNWHDLFYTEGAKGLLFFLELKERIRAEFNPDFLLIDARTGITEIGGVATTLLPDQVVCLLLNNQENLEGAREVIRGIHRVSAQKKKKIGIMPVLARLPVGMRGTELGMEVRTAEDVHAFLLESEEGDSSREMMSLPRVSVLHADESLAYHESLSIGSKRSVDESPLLRDYLRLFAQIIPSERVEPHLDRLVNGAMNDLLEKPDRVQSDLESLAVYCPHPTSYLALLKFYKLRNAPSSRVLQTAARYWELSGRSNHPLLKEIVWEHFKADRRFPPDLMVQLGDFVEAIWQAFGGNDPEIGLRLIDHMLIQQRNKPRALQIMQQLLAVPNIPPQVVVHCIIRLTDLEEHQRAQSLITQWGPTLIDSPDFQSAWASLVVSLGDALEAKKLFESKEFRPASILAKRPQVYIRLLKLADRREEMEAALQNSMDQSITSGEPESIMQTAAMFEEMGRLEMFKSRVMELHPKHRAERILEMLPPHRRRFSRFTGSIDE